MKKYSLKSHGIASVATLLFTILLASCDQPKKGAAPPAKTATTKTVATADVVTAQPQATEDSSKTTSPTTADIVALYNAMHGAANQQPDDAPKDQYGEPYIIGNLGGFPVNLPASVVSFVEYDDSPGWDIEKLRNYNPPNRNYNSIIESFSYRLRYTDSSLLDNKSNWHIYKKESEMSKNPWVLVGISSGSRNYKIEHPWDDFLNDDIEQGYRDQSPPYTKDEINTFWGLERYFIPGINPQNGIPWRQHMSADDIFVSRDTNGHVNTYIICSNNKVPHPPCEHYFTMSGGLKADVSLLYDRQILSDWSQIQKIVEKSIYNFTAFSTYAK